MGRSYRTRTGFGLGGDLRTGEVVGASVRSSCSMANLRRSCKRDRFRGISSRKAHRPTDPEGKGLVDDPESRFTALYDLHYRKVLAYALIRAEPHAAEDIVSETFLIAWRRLGDVPEHALPWLLGVARNLLHKQRDSRYRRSALADRIAALTSPQDLATWDVADHVVEREAALAALASLPERDLGVLELVMWHDLSPKDAAKAAGCSTAAFFVRLHRARRRLAKALESASRARPAPRTVGTAREATR